LEAGFFCLEASGFNLPTKIFPFLGSYGKFLVEAGKPSS
jgi:hypothetical protein